MKKIICSLILLTLLFGAIGILAQESDLPSIIGILPDSPLYFLKTWKEAIQNFFTFGAENKVKQFLHLADVRLAEYQKMVEKGKTEIAQKTLDKHEKQLNQALQKIGELKNKNKDIESISQKTEDVISKHIEILKRNVEKAPEAAKKGLENAIEKSSQILEKVKLKACTEEAKVCPDGTTVGRTGPNCEFSPCPLKDNTLNKATDTTQNKKFCNVDSDCGLLICSGCFSNEFLKTSPPDLPCRAYEGYYCKCVNDQCVAVK